MNTFAHPVGAVSNRTGLECLINSKIHYSLTVGGISESRHLTVEAIYMSIETDYQKEKPDASCFESR